MPIDRDFSLEQGWVCQLPGFSITPPSYASSNSVSARDNTALIETNITEWRRNRHRRPDQLLQLCHAEQGPWCRTCPRRPPMRRRPPPTSPPVPASTDYVPVPPTNSAVPRQEPGIRPARPLPYRPAVHPELDRSAGTFTLTFGQPWPCWNCLPRAADQRRRGGPLDFHDCLASLGQEHLDSGGER